MKIWKKKLCLNNTLQTIYFIVKQKKIHIYKYVTISKPIIQSTARVSEIFFTPNFFVPKIFTPKLFYAKKRIYLRQKCIFTRFYKKKYTPNFKNIFVGKKLAYNFVDVQKLYGVKKLYDLKQVFWCKKLFRVKICHHHVF